MYIHTYRILNIHWQQTHVIGNLLTPAIIPASYDSILRSTVLIVLRRENPDGPPAIPNKTRYRPEWISYLGTRNAATVIC